MPVEVERIPASLAELSDVEGLTSAAVLEGDLWLTQRAGRLLRVEPGGEVVEVLDITHLVSTEGEGGLLDLAFDPDGNRVYLSYLDHSNALNMVSFDHSTQPFTTDEMVEHVTVEHPSSLHVGGSLAFGPDGFLYVGVGDGALPLEQEEKKAAQDLASLRGKLLRIAPGAEGGYRVPADNPLAGSEAGAVWLYGLRNPWAFSFDPVTGDLWVPDVGEACWEEINLIPGGVGGANLGWPILEGTSADGPAPDDYSGPVYEYAHTVPRTAVIGGAVYRGPSFPDLAGAYLFADHGQGAVFALTVTDGVASKVERVDVSIPNPTRLIAMPDGEVAVMSATAGIFLIQPAEPS